MRLDNLLHRRLGIWLLSECHGVSCNEIDACRRTNLILLTRRVFSLIPLASDLTKHFSCGGPESGWTNLAYHDGNLKRGTQLSKTPHCTKHTVTHHAPVELVDLELLRSHHCENRQRLRHTQSPTMASILQRRMVRFSTVVRFCVTTNAFPADQGRRGGVRRSRGSP